MTNNSPKILIVEDEELNCKVLSSFLARRNYTVLTAGDAESALPIIKEEKPNLLLLDINLPKMSGLDLLKLVREFNQDIKVFILSGNNIDDGAMKMLNEYLKVDKFIEKPIQIADLDAAVKEAIGAK